jgi:hypothetical protein
MTAIDRTAYPRLGLRMNHEELDARYTVTDTDRAFVCANTRGEVGSLVLAMLLKTRQDFDAFQHSAKCTWTLWRIWLRSLD